MIAIIDYGTGNLRSIQNMFSRIGVSSTITSDHATILNATKLILPGVGHFDFGMNSLRTSGLVDLLDQKVRVSKTPILGICLGAQLLTNRSDEGKESGLGWINGETVAFDRSRLSEEFRIPHMGWTETEFSASIPLFDGLDTSARFYYVHSYHLRCEDRRDELCHANYGYRFVAGIRKDNIMGVQFHPEKSHRFGMQLLRNFARGKFA